MTAQIELYEYIGFKYIIKRIDASYSIEPLPGQHRAAAKEKHRRNALQCYLEDKIANDHSHEDKYNGF
jgi:hypothetical protein